MLVCFHIRVYIKYMQLGMTYSQRDSFEKSFSRDWQLHSDRGDYGGSMRIISFTFINPWVYFAGFPPHATHWMLTVSFSSRLCCQIWRVFFKECFRALKCLQIKGYSMLNASKHWCAALLLKPIPECIHFTQLTQLSGNRILTPVSFFVFIFFSLTFHTVFVGTFDIKLNWKCDSPTLQQTVRHLPG